MYRVPLIWVYLYLSILSVLAICWKNKMGQNVSLSNVYTIIHSVLWATGIKWEEVWTRASHSLITFVFDDLVFLQVSSMDYDHLLWWFPSLPPTYSLVLENISSLFSLIDFAAWNKAHMFSLNSFRSLNFFQISINHKLCRSQAL